MLSKLPDFNQARVLVVGDLMLDRYWHGGTSRISPEAPVPVVRVNEAEERPGGAANVALNIATLHGKVTLMGLAGEDEAGDSLQNLLSKVGIDCRFTHCEGFPTITKLRIISRRQQLIRLDFEAPPAQPDTRALNDAVKSALADSDVVIFSDYGKGALDNVTALIAMAREAGKIVLVDPKGEDFEKYRQASVITPNLSEFEAVVGPCHTVEDVEQKGLALLQQLELDALLVTRGEHGMTLLQNSGDILHLPTEAREVFDVTGAGDTVISVLGAALACQQSWQDATAIANTAAGVVVGKLGTAAITESELRLAMKGKQEHDLGVIDENELVAAIDDAKARGERVVFTNGCFDLLHAGHVTYLEQARHLGDRLVVAVNSDESVRSLKGPARPIIPLEQRMAVLAGLASVDWVVSFSEETPERLICNVLPDILVKGGDYKPEEIAGGQCVTEAGGEVKVLQFVDGCSTSSIVKKIERIKEQEIT